jgi:hypothetical protein
MQSGCPNVQLTTGSEADLATCGGIEKQSRVWVWKSGQFTVTFFVYILL